jgi:hypothetical protein
MKKISFLLTGMICLFFTVISCNVLKNLPTNTSAGIFSLNGNWRLETTNDNNALTGTTIGVLPIAGTGSITSLQNNTYCVRENDIIWKNITSGNSGSFTVNNLVNSCGSSLAYKPAVITVITNDQVRLAGTGVSGAELLQTWRRVVK